jgi:tetratricopeptide (TPR) repeat protein
LTAALGRIDSRFRPPTVTEDADAHLIAPQTETAVVDAAARPDAKEKVQIVRDLQRSLRFYEAGRYRDAIPLLERVVFSEPAIVEGWAMLGRSRAAAGQHALALEAYHEGLKRFPNNAELALLAANEYADAGNWAAAEEYARSVEANDPVVAHEALARFAARRGKLDTARQHAETVVRLAPGRVPTLMFLAELSRRSGRHADQLLWLDRAVREIAARDDQPFEGLHSARGQALAALGRIAEAEAAFRREMGQFPHNLAAWKDLAVLLGATGRRDAARQVLLSAIQANNTAEMRALARQAFAEIGDAGGMSFIESRIGTP